MANTDGFEAVCPEVAAVLVDEPAIHPGKMRALSKALLRLELKSDVPAARALRDLNRVVVDYVNVLSADVKGMPIIKADRAYAVAVSKFSAACRDGGSDVLRG